MTNKEINELVAERVMGASICRCDPKRPSPRFDGRTGLCIKCGRKTEGGYCTNPVSSKDLRDHMKEDGWCYVVRLLSSGRYVTNFARVRFSDKAGDNESGILESQAYGGTEEMPVACAALKSFGVKVAE